MNFLKLLFKGSFVTLLLTTFKKKVVFRCPEKWYSFRLGASIVHLICRGSFKIMKFFSYITMKRYRMADCHILQQCFLFHFSIPLRYVYELNYLQYY